MSKLLDPRLGVPITEKRSAESRLYTMDFTSLLDGATLTSVTSVVANNQGLVSGSSALTVGATSHDSGVNAQVRLSAGTNNEDYLIIYTMVDSASNTLVAEGLVQVRDIS